MRGVGRRAERAAPREAVTQALASAPPPTCTSSRSISTPADAISQPSVSPPSTARPLRLPWQVNGSAPPAIASMSARARSGRRERPPSRGQTVTTRAELLEPREHDAGRRRPGRRRAARRRPRRRRRRRRARRCRSSRSRGPAAPPARPGRDARATSRYTSTPNRCRALCEPETLPVSSLTQTPPVVREAEPVAQLVAARERRHREAVAVDRGDALVEPAHERAELVVGRSRRRARRGTAWSSVPVADERVRLRVVRREADACRVELAAEDVVDVVAAPAFGQRNG